MTTFGHDDFADRYPKPGHVLVPCPSANCFQSKVCLNGTFVLKDCGYFSMIAVGIWGIYRVSIGYRVSVPYVAQPLSAARFSRWFTAVFFTVSRAERALRRSVRSLPPVGGAPGCRGPSSWVPGAFGSRSAP